VDELEGKVAVVTGGAAGIGRGLAEAFAEEGMRLVLADIDEGALHATVSEMAARAIPVVGVVTDVSDPDAVTRLRDATYDSFGTAHVVCNNAGIGAPSPLTRPIDVDGWRRVFDVDFFAILHGINAFLPRLLEQGEGHIVNTSSRAGLVAPAHAGAYGPAKFASVAVTEMLHAELAELATPVAASVLTPGAVLTDLVRALQQRYEQSAGTEAGAGEFLARAAQAVLPIEVGRLVVRAIRERRLYINTHGETIDWLRERTDRVGRDAAELRTLL
jgi:NAD(P)-dependent dehydrogenase (short-subunit alcohol dehydrogenase family)